MILPEKFNSIERALIAAATMTPPDARNVLRLICEGGIQGGDAIAKHGSLHTTGATLAAPVVQSEGAAHYAKREKFIQRMQSACDRVLDYAKHETLRNIEKHFRDTGIKSAEGETTPTTARITFKKDRFTEELISALKEEQIPILATAGQHLFDEIGKDDPWKMPARQALQFLKFRANLFAKTSDEIHADVMSALQEGLGKGDTKKELMARITAAFDNIKQTRASTIANTETAAAFNFSRDKAMREAGVTHKRWLLSHSPLIKEHRITHAENDGQTVPVGDPFDISGVKFMYPSDDSLGAGPEDIINCHCVAIATDAPP